jgi:hypothetical protein
VEDASTPQRTRELFELGDHVAADDRGIVGNPLLCKRDVSHSVRFLYVRTPHQISGADTPALQAWGGSAAPFCAVLPLDRC